MNPTPQILSTLLRREWLQHKTGWLVIVTVPPLIGLLVLLAGQVTIDVDDQDRTIVFDQVPALALAVATMLGSGVLTFLLAWAATLIFAPTVVRRDVQDRSIEFWLSLPTGHAVSVTAPLLAHLLLFPLAALLIGMVAGVPLSLAVVARFAGLADWFSLPWASLAAAWVAVTLRLALGLVLATLWLSPLIMLVEAASAWLKRWGIPAVVLGIAVVANVLEKVFGYPQVWELGRAIFTQAGRAFVAGHPGSGVEFGRGADPQAMLGALPAWALADAGRALQALAQPLLLLCLAISAACFTLLVLRRQRG
jgi:hypothetical protein